MPFQVKLSALIFAILSVDAEARVHRMRRVAATTTSSAFQPDPTGIYDRMLSIIYGDNNSTFHSLTEQQFQGNFTAANITAVSPFLYNVPPDRLGIYTNMTTWLNDHNIPFFPAVGGQTKTNANQTLNTNATREMAQAYATVSRGRIRIENTSQYWINNATDFFAFVDYLIHDLKFMHIQVNPWPSIHDVENKNVTFADFGDNTKYIQSAYQGVQDSPNTSIRWQVDPSLVTSVCTKSNNYTQIMVYYEIPAQQLDLANNFTSTGQENAFTTTITQIDGWRPEWQRPLLHWSPPCSESYNPWKQGTWNWIAEQLNTPKPN